ncbi:hypothetical protein PDPUS_4_00001 (plasmid) [Photobacterium damselae subsp. piscicida]|uniref:Phage protein n=2 Tax=Photobacterium damselae TaxID=38293 RepID=A0A2T3Q328_PHODM|nr:hypothetical protein [Photobacterium damselae]MDP2514987.1 hypothetical protein [Photobacterium damselae subsp. piscicida]MDP2531474.1 hypothetical protein [Photobacterium damselae subsp. piscicida]MDP2543428.1 hypothetical protein [Photobacterium damselae subsp. piscicida]MDP2558484.1 hypothetical protein [Photobacterium damselae subsp. piscicida]MDP2567250.1 hypothetical protein [Photobacterium damselae subsp. piscicida]
MTRKLQIELSDETFAYLEMLAFGLEIEANGEVEETWKGFNIEKNDFSPAVRSLLVDIAGSIATGVRRPGSWERGVVDSLTGWQGTYNEGMLSELIKEEVKNS